MWNEALTFILHALTPTVAGGFVRDMGKVQVPRHVSCSERGTWYVARATCHTKPAKGLCHLSCRMLATRDEQRADVASCGVVMRLQNASCYSPRGNMVRRVCNRG